MPPALMLRGTDSVGHQSRNAGYGTVRTSRAPSYKMIEIVRIRLLCTSRKKMFQQKDFNINLLKELEPFFKGYGYKLVISKREFLNKDKEVELTFTLWSTLWSYGYSLQPQLHIRFLKAERIYKQFKKQSSFSFQYPMIVGNQLGDLVFNEGEYLLKRQSLDLYVEQEKDIAKLKQDLKAIFTETALPFYRRYRNLDYVEQVLNAPFEHYPKICNNIHIICRLGLILAMLTNNQNYEEIESRYLKINQEDGLHEESREEFKEFVGYLKKIK
jgi:hypothetical protein